MKLIRYFTISGVYEGRKRRGFRRRLKRFKMTPWCALKLRGIVSGFSKNF